MSKLAGRTFAPFETRSPTGDLVTLKIDQDTAIGEDLDAELRDQPQLIAWYSALRTEAKLDLDLAKQRADDLYEDLMEEARQTTPPVKPAAAYSALLKSQVQRSALYREAQQEAIAARYRVNQLDGHLQALEARHWSLQSLSAIRRQEQRSGLKDNAEGEE